MSAKWDREIERVVAGAQVVAAQKPDAKIAVAVDDERKRDYFVPRLRKVVNGSSWAERVTFCVAPMLGGAAVNVHKE